MQEKSSWTEYGIQESMSMGGGLCKKVQKTRLRWNGHSGARQEDRELNIGRKKTVCTWSSMDMSSLILTWKDAVYLRTLLTNILHKVHVSVIIISSTLLLGLFPSSGDARSVLYDSLPLCPTHYILHLYPRRSRFCLHLSHFPGTGAVTILLTTCPSLDPSVPLFIYFNVTCFQNTIHHTKMAVSCVAVTTQWPWHARQRSYDWRCRKIGHQRWSRCLCCLGRHRWWRSDLTRLIWSRCCVTTRNSVSISNCNC